MNESARSESTQQKQYWIENEGLLRDEGVLFGLAGGEEGLEHKLNAIRNYYGERIARAEEHRRQINCRRETIRDKQQAVRSRLDKLRARVRNPDAPAVKGADAPDVERHTLMRYMLGFLLAVAICISNFYVVYEQFAEGFEYPFWITTGIFLAGLFALFNPMSVLYTSNAAQRKNREAAELWKLHLIEFGMPLAAALFVVAWRYEALGTWRTIALFVYLYMFFLIGGKLLLSTLPRLSLVMRVLRRDWRVWRERRKARRECRATEEKIEALEEELLRLEEREDALAKTGEIEKARDTAVELFISEYELARKATAEGLITPEDVTQIARTKPPHVELSS